MQLALQNIDKSFGNHIVFQNLSFDFSNCGFYLLCGKSGSGKSTLLNILAGYEDIESGQRIVDASIHITSIFQTYELIDELTVYENLKMIEDIIRVLEVGKVYDGVVTRIAPFGAFVDLGGGKEGLLHISKISSKHINKVEDVLSVGDEIKAKVTEIDNQGKISLNMRDLEHHEE